MTTVNHWGKNVDTEKPVCGVISSNKINWEFVDNEICPTCEKWEREIQELKYCPKCDTHLFRGECLECLWTKEEEYESMECDDHEKLIGDWILDTKTHLYDVDKNGEFAAIVTDSTFNCVQVIWSKFTARHGLASICFPGQCDADSDGEFLCYVLPPYLLASE
jgi:hypothetical protein